MENYDSSMFKTSAVNKCLWHHWWYIQRQSLDIDKDFLSQFLNFSLVHATSAVCCNVPVCSRGRGTPLRNVLAIILRIPVSSPPRRRGEWRWCPISTGRHGAQCSLGRAQRSNFVICQQVRDGRPPTTAPTGGQGNGPRLKIFKLCPGGAIGETKQITL